MINLHALVADSRERIVSLAQRLLRCPSYSGQEQEAAAVVADELSAYGCHEVAVDEAGNVLGWVRAGGGPNVMLHAHLDVVDAGDESAWRYPPFGGVVEGGRLWGRGAVDDKGCVAAMVSALGLASMAGLPLRGDACVAAVVGEEVGGLGTRYLLEGLCPDVAVIGEPSGNALRRGHRGRFEFLVRFLGRSAHASAPHLGANPLYAQARFLLALREAAMAEGPLFGRSTAVPTLAYVDQTSSNVIPACTTVHIDWRNHPAETLEQATALLEGLAREAAEEGVSAKVELRTRQARAYTGLERTLRFVMPSFDLPVDHPTLRAARSALERTLGRSMVPGVWAFATDGGHLSAQGVPCVGFGPGDEALAHVLDEHLSVEELLEATVGYLALLLALAGGPAAE